MTKKHIAYANISLCYTYLHTFSFKSQNSAKTINPSWQYLYAKLSESIVEVIVGLKAVNKNAKILNKIVKIKMRHKYEGGQFSLPLQK